MTIQGICSGWSIGRKIPVIASVCVLLCAALLLPTPAAAIPDYAGETRQGCLTCHLGKDGGDLSETGLRYSASGYVWPPEGGYRVRGPVQKRVRFLFGLLHIIAGFMWFGTILYVHLILRPGYASRGLPKGEVVLGMTTMIVVGVTGVLLTLSKIGSIRVLYASTWGAILTVKIVLYLIMVSSAFFVVVFVGPRLKKGGRKAVSGIPEICDPETLSHFDGKEGRPAYVAYREKVYDMTGLRLWRDGVHMKHLAGHDLTDFLSKAPHGEEKLAGLPVVGEYECSGRPRMTSVQKTFYFIAYMNLFLVFTVLVVIAVLRWGVS